MIKIGDNYYRNLEEQVQKNKEDIANHYNIDRVLAEVGIKVIGQLPTLEDLEDKVGTEYGDAYAIGTEPPYDFYIWTRADVDSGHLEDYWFNIGQLAVIGPQGPMGPQGEKGDRGESSMWYYGTTPSNPREGDMLLQSSGNVLRYQKVGPLQYSWVQVVNIKGANGLNGLQGPQGPQGIQGPQGPKGDTGDVGGFINIYGILTNVNQLPNPDTLNNRTIAYLIGTGYPYDLYIQAGDANGPVIWVNSGPLNVSTLVFVNGEAQNTWNADVKADVTYVDNAIASIHFPEPDLTDYATKQYVNDAIANIDFPEPDLSNYATKEYVNEEIAGIDFPEPDLTGYATETYVNEAVKNVEVDLTDYATKQYVDDAIANIDIPGGGGGSSDGWKITNDRYHWELYQAKEIYITFYSNDSKNIFSHIVLPEGETLAAFIANDVMFALDPRANPSYFFWRYDGSAIEFYYDDGSLYYDMNKLLIAYKV